MEAGMTVPLHTIDHTVQLTREWVSELSKLLDWNDEQRTWRMLRITLQALRDWLDVNEAAQLGAQLPLLLRELYYERWRPAKDPVVERDKEAFLARIEESFATDPIDDPEEAACSVFRLLNNRISAGEIRDVRQRLPKHLRELWPEKAT
jgi:uncharacterized protein (DUF2267 family)